MCRTPKAVQQAYWQPSAALIGLEGSEEMIQVFRFRNTTFEKKPRNILSETESGLAGNFLSYEGPIMDSTGFSLVTFQD